jgi:Rhs element Vgr protein
MNADNSYLNEVIIKSNDVQVIDEYQLLSVDVVKLVNKIPTAEIIYLDGDAVGGTFSISDAEDFALGKNIEIQIKDAGANFKTIFIGIVVKHKIELKNHNSFLLIELKDVAFNLTAQKNNIIYQNKGDKDIIDEICSRYSAKELATKISVSNNFQNSQMVQHYCSDWDFILSRAEANGWWISVSDGVLSVFEPSLEGESNYDIDYNKEEPEINEFKLALDMSHQVNSIAAMDWNHDNQEIQTINQTITLPNALKADQTMDVNDYQLIHAVNMNTDELTTWAKAKASKNSYSLFRGWIKTSGISDILPGNVVELSNIGKRFNGKNVVTGIRHQVNGEGWQTDVQFGLAVDWFTEHTNISAPDAGGLLPPVHGLQIGVVQDYAANDDATNQLLVKVQLPTAAANNNLLWARLASVYAGKNHGVILRPEIGDEVVLGFFDNDPRFPVILGAMHSQTNKPPGNVNYDKNNKAKGIVIDENIAFIFDQTNKAVTLQNTSKNKLAITDQVINIQDKNKNSINFDANGIKCESDSEINITAKKITQNGQVESK